MKEGWEVKKLGDVCSLLTDGDWIESKDQSMNGIRLIQTGNVGNGIYRDKSDHAKYISEETFDKLNCTEIFEGDILISRLPEPIGRACILPKIECRMITAVDCSIIRLKEIMLSKYLVYYTLSRPYNKGIEKYVTGAVRKRISRANLSKILIPIPPLPEQFRIVEELDQLSNIIEKKRQQLSELDNLAQSIFYDMFGDPVTNEKGWEVKKLGEVCEPKSKIIRANKQYLSKDKIRYIDISSIDNSCNTITHTNVMNFGDAPSRAQQIVLIGDVLVSLVRPNLRNIALISYDYDDLVASTGFCVLRTIEIINSYYLLYCVLGENFTDYLMERTSGANYPAVREEDIKGYDLCIPPLSLQQLFAQKIEAIEKEKELIKQSIKETEELFNSRMDYYFG